MTVMLFCPTYRLEPETVQAIFGQDYSGGIDFVFTRDNPHDSGRENILYNYQKGREIFLSRDYEALIIIESDVIPPLDAVTRLLAMDCDAAYGTYLFRTMWEKERKRVINIHKYEGGRGIGMPLTTYKEPMPTGIIPCSGAGLGCIALKRHVMMAIPFVADDNQHCDTMFTKSLYRAGYSMKADMNMKCGHKMTTGEIITP